MAIKKPSPAVDMTWLSDWRVNCLKHPTKANHGDFDHEMRLVRRPKNRPRFISITADQGIRIDITKIYQSMLRDQKYQADPASAQSAIQRFLVASCWVPNLRDNSKMLKDPKLSPNRSDTARDLSRLSKAAYKLARSIHDLKQPLGGATNLAYLQSRFDSGNPPGFSTNRHGYVAYRDPGGENPKEARLQDLLACFAMDANEACQLIQQQIKIKREVEGKYADRNSFIDLMLSAAKPLTTEKHPKPNFSLIAKIGTLLFAEGIESSAVRKRYNA